MTGQVIASHPCARLLLHPGTVTCTLHASSPNWPVAARRAGRPLTQVCRSPGPHTTVRLCSSALRSLLWLENGIAMVGAASKHAEQRGGGAGGEEKKAEGHACAKSGAPPSPNLLLPT